MGSGIIGISVLTMICEQHQQFQKKQLASAPGAAALEKLRRATHKSQMDGVYARHAEESATDRQLQTCGGKLSQ